MSKHTTIEDQKRAAAEAALEYVKSGMRLGLGTGSTAEHFVRALAPRVKAGLKLTTVATSERTAVLARELGLTVGDLDTVRHLDLTVDGADEIGPNLTLIKGGGGALLREKIVASASDRMLVIADAAKVVDTLGRFPLPVEIVPFAHSVTMERIADAAARCGCAQNLMRLRGGEAHPFKTDSGNYIADCSDTRCRGSRAVPFVGRYCAGGNAGWRQRDRAAAAIVATATIHFCFRATA
jgi:ribose 5-phosphate isomerase A